MDSGDVQVGTRRTLKQRLGFIGIGCCGATTWMYRSRPSPMNAAAAVDQDQDYDGILTSPGVVEEDNRCDGEITPARSVNLAAALAAEREYRAAQDVGTPLRMSLMRLLEEPEEGREAEVVATVGNDRVCCVCMGREKGAAFIPCGHTFCRVCSRELWVNRGSCPLCNRFILEILDIF
ncbi:uncharacterized protein LOC124923380 isoform X2 [Impatiens glandulifera]|nr:uncharacterized protein LOC124923380 isoform X2 [Impatiens glandulifera]